MGVFSKLTRPKPKEFIIKSNPLVLGMTEAPLDMQFMAIGAPFDADRKRYALNKYIRASKWRNLLFKLFHTKTIKAIVTNCLSVETIIK